MPAYDDSQWTEGKGGFGNSGTNGATAWKTSDIWLRREFNPGALAADQIANLVVRDFHLGYVEVFINGVRAYSQRWQSHSWEYRGVAIDARASVKPNSENVLAVHCTRGGDDRSGGAVRKVCHIASPMPWSVESWEAGDRFRVDGRAWRSSV